MRCYPFSGLIVAIAALLQLNYVDAVLSTPLLTDKLGLRALEIATVAALIKNEPRTFAVGNATFPFYTGPVAVPGSLAFHMRLEEVAKVRSFLSDLPNVVAASVTPRLATVKTLEDMAALYNATLGRVERPTTVDNSDENFGAQRLSLLAMKLRLVSLKDNTATTFQLSDAQLAQLCGRGITWRSIVTKKSLFVEDFADAAQWNDPVTADTKFVPNAVGFFCYNRESQKLLPVEIRFPDTGLNYSPLDSESEWTLAKIALNAASVSFHQWRHMVDTHAVAVPIRVELLRTMAAVHPVRVLLSHHMSVDVGLELLLGSVLLSPNTAMDQTFGWGATGATQFLAYELENGVSMKNDLPTDLAKRGLTNIPTHKYAIYATLSYTAISKFVSSYVRAYYPSDKAIKQDFELQNWAAGCAKVPHLKEFPAKISKRSALIKLVTHLVFLSGVKHHAMNGAATWHMMSVPYSPSALWKKLPTQKLQPGEKLDLMAYAVPLAKVPVTLGLSALFYRPIPSTETMPQAYRKAAFAKESCLQPAIAKLESAMAQIDAFIAEKEADEKHPYVILRPSLLPYYSWA